MNVRTPPLHTLLFLLTWLFVSGAHATPPAQIPYQGLLLNSAGGTPVTTSVSMDFAIYDMLIGGTALWNETHATVPVLDGVYSVDLGTFTPLTSAVLQSGTVFLEIVINGETLSPRQQFLSVPYALSADTAVSASTATTAANATNLDGQSGQFYAELLTHFSFDGADPPNLDPSEGLADTDGDGLLNFVDSDNDNDGLSDGVEVGAGSDINLVTPTISGFSPTTSDGFVLTQVVISGTHFTVDSTVQFGSQTPSISNFSPMSITVTVGGQPEGNATVVVTRPNGETDSSVYPFFLDQPTISAFLPAILAPSAVATVSIQGTFFVSGMTVQFGAQNPTPTNITATSLDVLVGPFVAGDQTVIVTHPNGNSANALFPVIGDRVIFATSTTYNGAQVGGLTNADAFCQTRADAAGLPGFYQAWLSTSAASPNTRLNQNLGPYRNTNGDLIANDWTDLTDGALTSSISYNEFGGLIILRTWTNTQADGQLVPAEPVPCGDWTSTSGAAIVGFPTFSDGTWTNWISQSCSLTAALYCVGN